MDLVSEAAGAGGEERMRRGYRMKREFQSSLWSGERIWFTILQEEFCRQWGCGALLIPARLHREAYPELR